MPFVDATYDFTSTVLCAGSPSTTKCTGFERFRPEHLPEMVMPPQEAVQRMVRNEVELLPIEASKAGTLLSALVRFKELHEANAPLAEVLTEFTARHTARYGGMRLRDLCAEMHAFFRDHDTSGLQRRHGADRLPRTIH